MPYYVIEINENGKPGRLWRFTSWGSAVMQALDCIKETGDHNENEGVYVEHLEGEAQFEYGDGGGVYILCEEKA